MKLIADSGSTKTDWGICTNGEILQIVKTQGINPFYQTTADIVNILKEELIPKLGEQVPKSLYFYGAGCSFPEKSQLLHDAFKTVWSSELTIDLQSDLVGAARAVCGKEAGIACILGTGSNSCHWDGEKIAKNVPPLGYILGDEGSGAVLGKLFIADLLKNQLPKSLSEKFYAQYNTDYATLMEQVYKQPFPNRNLAQYAYFLHENRENPAIHKLVKNSFDAFVKRNLQQYPQELPVSFVGSVAVAFQDILTEVLKENNFKIGKIVKSPINELIAYHNEM